MDGQKIRQNNVVREKTRKLLVFYDLLLLAFIWAIAFILHPSMPDADILVCACHFLIMAFLFTLLRFVFRCYRQIWRLGRVGSYAREIAVAVIASNGYLICAYFIRAIRLPFTACVAYSVSYSLLSLVLRIFYYYLFRYLRRDNRFTRRLRRILRPLTLVDFDSAETGALLQVALEPATGTRIAINSIENVALSFAIQGEVTAIRPITKGYINQTYCVETQTEDGKTCKYLLQKINTDVFHDVDALMENYKFVTERLIGTLHLPGGRREGCVQSLIVARDGRSYLNRGGECWRMMTFFDGVYSLDIPDSPDTFYETGVSFGRFMLAMSSVDAGDVKTVIPNFHDTRLRYQALEEAIDADVKKRASKVGVEISFYRKRSAAYGVISDALRVGRIPTRVCHNDCNLNNILFDEVSHLPVAIIDLDTVMPGSPLYDFGDSMRIGTNTAKDDEKDLSKVKFNTQLYEKYARGYLSACGKLLTRDELELLPFSSLVITAEDGIRFLADHINGDTYYQIFYTGQNLDRCRTQLKLLYEMERALPEIVRILNGIYSELGLDCVLDEVSVVSRWRG